ncbi:hypothetical protein SNE40_017217 [Patella caerulea]|uniref:CUB domain-containing protein n=1 Tax=Patella caerulea TaxID=87958 RepID=A0AAN8JGQ4_PATCE
MYTCYERLMIVLFLVDLFVYCCGEACSSLKDKGQVCSDVTALNELNIQVDNRIGDGCYCDVRVVNGSDNSESYKTSVDSPGGIEECGYSVDVTHTGPPVTFTCNKLNPFFMYVKKGDIIKFHFKREFLELYETPNFCIRVESRSSIQNVRFGINCTRIEFFNTSTTPALPTAPSSSTTVRLRCTLQEWIIYIGTAGGIVFIMVIIIIILSSIILQKEERYKKLVSRLNVAETKVNTDRIHPTYDHNNIIPDATYDMDDGEMEHTFQLGVPDTDDNPFITAIPNYGEEPNTLKCS